MGFGSALPPSDDIIEGSRLEQVQVHKDLGIYVDKGLPSSNHCAKISAKARGFVHRIRRTFITRNSDVLLKVLKIYERPILETNFHVWSPVLKLGIRGIERAQRTFTKMLPNLQSRPYSERLKCLKIESLWGRRLKLDLIIYGKLSMGF